MNLEKLFHLYLEQAKNQVLILRDNERTRACQWIKKIELAPNPEEQVQKLQLHSLKLLLLSLDSNCLTGPFEEPPEDDKEFAQYDWDSYQLSDFSNMIRSKQDTGKRPEVSYTVSGNRRELVTYQDDPATGQHCYYACSKQPIEEWRNLQGGFIENESIDQWKERGELEELNRTESQNSSVEIPRCMIQTTNSEVGLNPNDERYCNRNSSRCQRIPNSSNKPNYVNPGSSRPTNYERIHTGKPETPQKFGGRGQTNRPYELEQFELSQNEQFRSPRGVFQNLDYDRFQTHRSARPPRLTDEVIESFENARVHRGPLSEVKDDDAKQKLCARLQTIRDGMNKKPQVEIEHQIEVEPEMIPYERITLHEPCEDASCHQETEQDLGILSESDMDDEVLFGDHQTIDPRTIFKTKDENLVSRNVLKIETNTTINGSKREVIEEILEKEDVNVVERTEEDENLVDISEPTFESLPGHSSLESNDHIKKSKPRRVLEDYSDLPQDDLEDISELSFQPGSSCQEHGEGIFLYSPRKRNRIYSGRHHRRSPHDETAERLDEVSHPDGFLSSIEDTFQDSTRRTRRLASERPLPQVETSEQLNLVSHPRFMSCFEDTNQDSTRKSRLSSSQRPLPQVEKSGQLDQVSHPVFASSIEDTYQDSSRRTTSPTRQKPLPRIDTSERLDEISDPSCMAYFRDSTVPSRRGILSNRRLPQVDTSERLDEISQPKFLNSTEISHLNSTRRIRCPKTKKPLPQMKTSEKLDQVSHPSFLSSIEYTNEESTRRTRCPTSKRPLPQETSEKLDQISRPEFLSSIEHTYQDSTRRTRSPTSQKPLPQIDTSERLDQISDPSCMASYRDSTVPSIRGRGMSSNRRLPQIDTSERLDEVSQPKFLHSTEVSHQDSTRRTRCPSSQRPSYQVEPSEKLDQISHPEFLSSIEDTYLDYQDSERRSRCRTSQKPLPQIDTSERLDEISNPSFMASFRDSTVPSRRGRGMSSNRRLPQVDTSERLDEVSQLKCLHSTEVSHQDSTRRTRCPSRPRPLYQVEPSEELDQISHPEFMSSGVEDTYQDTTRRTRCPSSPRPLPQIDTSERLDEVSQPKCLHSTEVSHQDSTRRTRCPSRPRPLYQVEPSEELEQISHPEFMSSVEDTYQDTRRRTRCPSSPRPLPRIDTSERLDEISNPSCMVSFRDSTVPSRQSRGLSSNRRFPQVDTSEKLDEVSQPRFLHSTEVSNQGSTRRTRCPTSQTPLPQMETSEKLDQVSHPKFLSSIEDSYKDCRRRCKCPLSQRTVPQVEISDQLDQASQPSYITSLKESSLKSGVRKGISPHRPLQTCDQANHCIDKSRGYKQIQRDIFNPEVDDSEMLDEVSQPEFQSSYADSCLRSRENRETLVPGMLPQVDESEWLDDVCHPEYQSSFQTSSMQNTGQSPKQKRFPPVDISEKIESICQPEFPSSFEDSKQRSKRQTQNRITLTKKNVSERLDDISQPFCPTSFEDSLQRSREYVPRQGLQVNAATSGISDRVCQRALPQVEESEILDGVTQPDLTSFEDTGYGSKDSLQGICHEVEDLRRLDDISQPQFQSTYCDSILSSRENRRIEEERPFPFVDTSERLDNICQPDFPNSFEASIRSDQSRSQIQKTPQSKPFESGGQVCQPNFQSSLKDSHRRQKQSMHTPRPALRFSSQESSQTPERRKQDSRQRLLSRVDTSERLDDVSQPFHPSFLEDSMYDREGKLVSKKRHILRDKESTRLERAIKPDSTSHRPFHQVSESDYLENVSQPVFHSSFEDSRQTPSMTHGTAQRRPRNKIDTAEKLNDISQPVFPTSYEDSMKNSGRYIETPRRRPLPVPDISEKLEDVCHPSFGSSFEKSSNVSRRCENKPVQRPFPQVDESEKLDDESQPDFVSTLKNSTAISRGSRFYPSHVNDSGRTCFENSKQISVRHGQSLDNRPFPQINISERLNDISQPDFPTSFENTVPRSMRTSEPRGFDQNESSKHKSVRNSHSRQQRYPEIDISERLDDVCEPTFEDSKDYSRRNKSRPNQEFLPTEKQQNVHHCPNVSCSLDQSGIKSRHLPMQKTHHDTSEMLEDVMEPEFPPSFQESMHVSSERRITGVEKRTMPQIDLSENIESICQPEFPETYEDSTRNDMQQNVSSTYRKNKDYVTSFPHKNLADISAPTFNSHYEDSRKRGHGDSYLAQENLEDISAPSFQETPKLPPINRHREEYESKGPQRQLFPKKDSTNEGIERPGDFRQVFQSMPNYAPFEQQVTSKKNPVPSRLKLPVTFGQTMAPLTKNYEFRRTEMVYPRPQTQLNTLPTEDLRSGRMRPQNLNQANPCTLQIPANRSQMEPKRPAPTVSSTRIPLPPSARSQKNVQHAKEIEIPANQERLVKKSSVKFHQTKSTYFKNKQDKSNDRRSRR